MASTLTPKQKKELRKMIFYIGLGLLATLSLLLFPKVEYGKRTTTPASERAADGEEGNADGDTAEKPQLEATFVRWFREKDHLLVTFRFKNNGQRPITEIEVSCTGFDVSEDSVQTFVSTLEVPILPGKNRSVANRDLGRLDPMVRSVACAVLSWK